MAPGQISSFPRGQPRPFLVVEQAGASQKPFTRRAFQGNHPASSGHHVDDELAYFADEVRPQDSLARWAASSAFSISAAVERGISQNVCPVTGVGFSK